MTNIVDFNKSHIAEAKQLILANFNEARGIVKALPRLERFPDFSEELEDLSENVGVVMLDKATGKMIGFICFDEPLDNAFGSLASGTISPIHAHGTVAENRAAIYKRLYQAAAKKWVDNGVTYHAISLYSHDAALVNAFFTLGFGLRCIDAVRPLEGFDYAVCKGISYAEIPQSNAAKVRGIRKSLNAHLGDSPSFVRSSDEDAEKWLNRAETRDSRLFIASLGTETIAYIEVMDDGENFISDTADTMRNIHGAFCLPEHRGKGVMQGLLNYVITTLKDDDCNALGVDFESLNLSSSGFWLKHFEPYTYTVVRRIDEIALTV